MFSPMEVERLKRQYAGQTVTVDARRPELARFAEMSGRVVAVNCNGRALVEFEGLDSNRYDIAPEFLKVESSP